IKHRVSSGETLAVIARRYGVSVNDVVMANMIANPALIRPGQELVIPGAKVPAPTPTVQANLPTTTAPTTTPPANSVPADVDLDTGLGDGPLSDVPVIQIEEADPANDEPIRTIGGGNAGNSPPVFR